jgi:hypothetical protein
MYSVSVDQFIARLLLAFLPLLLCVCLLAVLESKAKQKHGGAVASGAGMFTIKGHVFDPTFAILVDLQV